MAFHQDHELHKRRAKRNIALGLVLGSFVALVFGITMAKLSSGQMLQAFNHTLRPSLVQEQK